MVLAGLMNPIVNGSIFALLQANVPARAPLGLAVVGPFADVIGVRAWFLAGGVIILMSTAAYFLPFVKNIEKESA